MTSKRTVAAIIAASAVTLSLGGALPNAEACTRIFANDKGDAMLVARSMDWATTTERVLTVFPRGMTRDGGHAGPMVVVEQNPA
jgi:penicillin V acylase-like amidase (Ntn superfamily)